MTTIKATCPQHGEVSLRSDEIELRVRSGGDDGEYSFICPREQELVKKPADLRVIRLLMSGEVEVLPLLETTPEAVPETVVEPFPYNEVLDGMILLEFKPDRFWEMMQKTSSNLPENS